jgi:hypothetical protein
MLAVLSFSASKRAHWLLAAYPGFALLVAQWWPGARGRLDRASRGAMAAAAALVTPVVALVLLGVAPADVVALASGPRATPASSAALLRGLRLPAAAWLAAGALAALGVVAARSDRAGRGARMAAALGGHAAATLLLLALVVLPRLNAASSARAGAEHLARLADRGVRVVAYRFSNTSGLGSVLFYAGRRFPAVEGAQALRDALAAGPTCAVMRPGDWAALAPSLPAAAVPPDAFPGFRLTIVESAPGVCTADPDRGLLVHERDGTHA